MPREVILATDRPQARPALDQAGAFRSPSGFIGIVRWALNMSPAAADAMVGVDAFLFLDKGSAKQSLLDARREIPRSVCAAGLSDDRDRRPAP